MAGRVPFEERKTNAPYRSLLVIGTYGIGSSIDPEVFRGDALEFEASYAGLLRSNERLRAEPDTLSDNHYVDWQLSALSEPAAARMGALRTMSLLRILGVNPEVIEIKGAFVTGDTNLFDRFPEYARPDMADYTDEADFYIRNRSWGNAG